LLIASKHQKEKRETRMAHGEWWNDRSVGIILGLMTHDSPKSVVWGLWKRCSKFKAARANIPNPNPALTL
jgi:hypothetical protein